MSKTEMRRELEQAGFKHAFTAYYGPTVLVFVVVVLAVVAWQFADRLSGGTVEGKDAAGGIVGIGAFIIAYQQWRAARMEASMDKYYERLDLANRRKEVLPGIDKYDMYIFTELDNLEYMLERYKLGYTSTAQAFRCLKSFQSRCRDDGFRSSALRWVAEAGYHETTKEVATKIGNPVQAPTPK